MTKACLIRSLISIKQLCLSGECLGVESKNTHLKWHVLKKIKACYEYGAETYIEILKIDKIQVFTNSIGLGEIWTRVTKLRVQCPDREDLTEV